MKSGLTTFPERVLPVPPGSEEKSCRGAWMCALGPVGGIYVLSKEAR